MPERIQGTVKWFSNRKGFGFVSPVEEGDDVFLHHSKIVSDAEYKTLKEGLEVQFEIGTDEEGKPFADQVTSADGSKIPVPPKKDPKPKKAAKPVAEENGDAPAAEGSGDGGEGGTKKKRKNRKKKKKAAAAIQWYSELDEAAQKSMQDRGITIDAGRAFVSVGDARLKIGTGGYVTLAHASGLLAEGSYTHEATGALVVTWERTMKYVGSEWKLSTVEADSAVLVTELNLTDDAVTATGSEESPDTLWGAGKPDPKETLELNGFQMRKVALNAAANPGRRRGRGPQNGGDGDSAPAAES